MNKNKFGLVFGFFFAFFHLVWIILVAVGLAQLFLDFILNIHMVYNPFLVSPFSLSRSIILLIFTFIIGYVFGYVLAFFWNKFCDTEKKKIEKDVESEISNAPTVTPAQNQNNPS